MLHYSVYLHIPFCHHRCGYCDFNTYAGLEELISDYVRALCTEIRTIALAATERLGVHTIFFGGGTPSLLPSSEVAHILETLHTHFDFSSIVEITLEANPGTLSLAYLQDLHSLGVNRLSVGMQSANPWELHLLERQHDFTDVIRSVAWARQAGFDNLNLDLIFGLPEQELETWQRSLESALSLHPEHLALYALTLEHGTPFGRWFGRGLLSEPDADRAADMYDWASEHLENQGYAQYEISNWALQPSGNSSLLACRHNLQYWRNLPYLGLGAGAHGYAASTRTANVLSPASYIQRLFAEDANSPKATLDQRVVNNESMRVNTQQSAIFNQQSSIKSFPLTPATQSAQFIDRRTEIAETMIMGLRLTQEGVSSAAFRHRFGQSLEEIFQSQIDRLLGLGLIERAGENGDCLRLTHAGRLLGNQVFVEFI